MRWGFLFIQNKKVLLLFIFEDESYYFDVAINGVTKVHIRNDNPRTFTNVEVYAGGKNHASANAEIRNFQACQIL